ncbi:MAG: hypothetical protein K6G68_04280 [Oscillospiraceae bacterium]|nr:hypothetical protein [Oscillospiraceae bacterium]
MEKNNGTVSKWDAFRIYNGHGFIQSLIRSALLIIAGDVLLSVLFAAMSCAASEDGTFIDYFTNYATSLIYLLLWVFVLMKRISYADMGDTAAPGGKYFCTVKGRTDTFAKAHSLAALEPVVILLLICVPAYIYRLISNIRIVIYLWGVSYLFDNFFSETIYFLISPELIAVVLCMILPAALSNLLELSPYQSHKSTIIALIFILTPVLIAVINSWGIFDGIQFGIREAANALFSVAVIVLLIVSEKKLIKKKTAEISDDVITVKS